MRGTYVGVVELLAGHLELLVLLLPRALKVQVVHPVLRVELRRRNVHVDLDLALVPRGADGLHDQVQRLLGVQHVGGEPALVAHARRVLARTTTTSHQHPDTNNR